MTYDPNDSAARFARFFAFAMAGALLIMQSGFWAGTNGAPVKTVMFLVAAVIVVCARALARWEVRRRERLVFYLDFPYAYIIDRRRKRSWWRRCVGLTPPHRN